MVTPNKDRGYLGNTNLKKINIPVEYTPDQIQEFVKCTQDIVYFINNYIKIVHVDRGIIPFKLWPFQEKLIRTVVKNRYSIAKLARQVR